MLLLSTNTNIYNLLPIILTVVMAISEAHQTKDANSNIYIKLYNEEHSNVKVALKRNQGARFVRMLSS